MAERLLTLGHDVVVYNRTQEKMYGSLNNGALLGRGSAAEAIEASKCTILTLADTPAIHEALFASGKSNFQNRTIIQMGTIAPSESITLGQEIRTGIVRLFRGAGSREYCGKRKAAAFLSWSGGTAEHVERWQEVLNCFCEAPLLVGPVRASGCPEAGLESTHCGPYHGLFLEPGLGAEIVAWKSRRS